MKRSALFLVALLVACGGAEPAPQPPPTPSASGPAPSASIVPESPKMHPPVDPFAVPADLEHEQLPADLPRPALALKELPAAAKDAPKPPKECAAFVSRKPAKAPACADRPSALAALDAALGEKDAASRDAALAALEACAGLPPGVARALRAELAPTACGDALVEPTLKKPPKDLDPLVQDALVGLGVAARLARVAQSPPKLAPPFDKARVLAFQRGPGIQWATKETQAIAALGESATKLAFYGKAIAELEGGVAELRIVETLREMPVPDEIKKFDEAVQLYYAGLDQSLEAWKTRGRNATLVGMGTLAQIGEARSDRIERARRLLSKLYGGRRIDALDKLLLPPIPAPTPSVEGRLAARLGAFWAGLLLPAEAWKKPDVLAAFAARGVPVQHRIAMKTAELDEAQRVLYARARLEAFRAHWRKADAAEAVRLAAKAGPSDEARLYLALALALRGGPGDAGQMMIKAPLESLGVGGTAALDALAARAPVFGELARFDGAFLREISPPDPSVGVAAVAGHYKDVAQRYRDAEARLRDPAAKKEAGERAAAADAIARELVPPLK